MHLRLVLSVLATVAMFATVVRPAAAQTTPAANPFVIHGQVGSTFSGPTGALFGAGVGTSIKAAPGLVVFGEFGKLTNIMNGELQDLVDELAGVDESGAFDFDLEIALPTNYGLAGARFDVASNAPVRVFVEGGLGFARVGWDVSLVVDGEDVSEAFRDLLEDQGVDLSSTTEMLLVVGGGVTWPVTPTTSIAGGVRINRIAASGGITKPSVYVGVVWRP